MKGALQLFLILPVVFFLLPLFHQAAGQEAYHQFANKDGQEIEAKIVSVTPDWKTMKIQRRDGRDFDMAVNVLSLDDQQIVKDWIKANPNSGPKIDYNLDVEIEKKSKTTKNERDSYYKYKTMEVSYEIAIKNRTRQELLNAQANYVVIIKDNVQIGRDSSGRPDYYSGSSDDGEVKFLRKSLKLKETLPYNHDHTFLTEAIEHHQIFGDGNVSYGEDKILGVILQVVGPNDGVLGEFRSPESYIQKVTWDQVKGNGFRSNSTGPAGSPDSPDPETPEMTENSSELPSWLEIRELSEWPEELSKGDTVPSSVVPASGGKSVRLSALVDVDEEQTGGVIVASGGQGKGFALFVLNDALHFRSKKLNDDKIGVDRTIRVPLADLPSDEFKVNALYSGDALRIWINDELKAEGESVGLLQTRPQEGLSVGYDSEESSVGPVKPPHAFRGSIRNVTVQFIE